MTSTQRKINRFNLITLCSLLVLALGVSAPGFSVAGEIELDDDMNAKLARHKSKQRVLQNRNDDEDNKDGKQSSNQECGSLGIGNVVQNSRVGGVREVNVIVTGDVINAFNKCK